jgi:hypothetical protein
MSYCEINALDMFYDEEKYGNSSDPNVWGPAFWFSLHNGAARYPNKPSFAYKNGLKGFISGIPFMLPCPDCARHASEFISRINLDLVVSSKQNLFTFFCDFHNSVNRRYGKPLMHPSDAFKLYTSPNVSVKCLQKYE